MNYTRGSAGKPSAQLGKQLGQQHRPGTRTDVPGRDGSPSVRAGHVPLLPRTASTAQHRGLSISPPCTGGAKACETHLALIQPSPDISPQSRVLFLVLYFPEGKLSHRKTEWHACGRPAVCDELN